MQKALLQKRKSKCFKLNLTILTIFANLIMEIDTTDKQLVQIHISYEK